MAKLGAVQYYNLLVNRLNRLIDKQVKLFYDKPISPEDNISYLTGTINGLKIIFDEMEDLVDKLNKQEIILKDTGHNIKIIEVEEDIEVIVPTILKKDFKYE